jgi:hypothetical protein
MTQGDDRIEEVLDMLSLLEPTAADAPRPAAQALARMRPQLVDEEDKRFSNRIRRFLTMSNRKYSYAALLVILLFGLAFAFPAVRAAANDFLGLFRVQKFAAISISPEQIAILERMAEEGLMPGELEVTEEPGELTPVDSLGEAAVTTGLIHVRTLDALGKPDEIYVADGGSGRLTIDLEGARAIVEAAGADPALLPDSLDGARVDVVVFTGVQQSWSDGTMLMQTESPLVEYPDDLDPTLLGGALLQVLGMNADEAQRLAQQIDWTSTLLLPVPQDFATFSEVTVDGVSGIALSSLDGEGSALLWQKDGVVYLLSNNGSTADLLSLAGSLR